MKPKILERLVKPSTLEFFRRSREVEDMTLFDRLHGYVYGRWPYHYIGIGVGEHWLARRLGPVVSWIGGLLEYSAKASESQHDDGHPTQGEKKIGFADTYHGKVVPLESAKQLVTINQPISLLNLEQVIPYARARDIILQNPDHIIALDCPCRVSRADPCLPLDVCLVVGEPFASFVSDHQPNRSRWITPDEAQAILQAEDARGHVHHAFFKDAMLGRFYAICNCCACCCGAMDAQRNGTPMLASSGFVAQVDKDLCIGCEECDAYCQFDALSLQDFIMKVDTAACMGCGVCVDKCLQEALTLTRDPQRGEPLEIVKLIEQAGV